MKEGIIVCCKFIHLLKRQTKKEREGETKKERELSSTDSLFKCPKHPGLPQTKTSSPDDRVPNMGGRSVSTWASICCSLSLLPGYTLPGSWIRSRVAESALKNSGDGSVPRSNLKTVAQHRPPLAVLGGVCLFVWNSEKSMKWDQFYTSKIHQWQKSKRFKRSKLDFIKCYCDF